MKRRCIKQDWFGWWEYWMLHSNENPGSGQRKTECKYIQYTFLYEQVWRLCLSTESSIVSCTGMSLNAMMCVPEAHARWHPLCCHISPASAASEVKTSPLDRLFFLIRAEKRNVQSNLCPWNVPSRSADWSPVWFFFCFFLGCFSAVIQQLVNIHL